MKEELENLFTDFGYNLFGKYVDEVCEAVSEEVIQECEESGDGNLQKALAYVILDKFGAFPEC